MPSANQLLYHHKLTFIAGARVTNEQHFSPDGLIFPRVMLSELYPGATIVLVDELDRKVLDAYERCDQSNQLRFAIRDSKNAVLGAGYPRTAFSSINLSRGTLYA